MRSISILSLLLIFTAAMAHGQTPSETKAGISVHSPAKAEAKPMFDQPRSMEDGRFGFLALFEVRFSPGVIKTLDIRQFFSTEQNAVEGFMRVKASMPVNAVLVEVTWVSPTHGQSGIGN